MRPSSDSEPEDMRDSADASPAERPACAGHREIHIEVPDGFTWESVTETCAELGVAPSELAGFALLYYLADYDSGRVARQVPRPSPGLRGLSSELPGS